MHFGYWNRDVLPTIIRMANKAFPVQIQVDQLSRNKAKNNQAQANNGICPAWKLSEISAGRCFLEQRLFSLSCFERRRVDIGGFLGDLPILGSSHWKKTVKSHNQLDGILLDS
jgi:hypothetical protein